MDIQAALKDGYTQDEVMAELGKRTGMNYKQALADGNSPEDVLGELSKRDSAGNISTPKTKSDNTPEWAGRHPNLYGALGAAKEITRFGGETAGLIGGGILGAPLGPAGAVAGAALGYGGVKALGRALEGEKATLPQAALGCFTTLRRTVLILKLGRKT